MLSMIDERRTHVFLIGLATVASGAFAAFIAIDSVRTVARIYSPLPWFDAWATFELLQVWADNAATPLTILFSQHNEHRILVPRLLFFADDFWFHGLGQIGIIAIFLVQALHAGLFLRVLGTARPIARGRWAVGGIVVALMFSLGQAENFSSGFQLAFVGVFASATASFLLFAHAVTRRAAGRGRALASSFAIVLVSALTMANGIVAACVLVVMALLARQGWRVALACAAWAAAISVVYFHGYDPVEQNAHPADAMTQPVEIVSYVAIYLGSALNATLSGAGVFGLVGIAAAIAATIRVGLTRPTRPTSLMLVGVMLFVGATAAITASGRINYGLQQALSSRYVTGSVTFWCAQLCFWWTDPPVWPANKPFSAWAARIAVGCLGLLLVIAMDRAQSAAKPGLWTQSFLENDASNLLLLGLDDPAVIDRTAWSDADVQALMPLLRERGLSIFGGPDGRLFGTPLNRERLITQPDFCSGSVTSAVADPGLGEGGARISGLAWNQAERRQIRRVLLTNQRGIVVGFASSGIPGGSASEWRGYAVAPVGENLSAYGVLDGARLCAVGNATLMAPSGKGKPSGAS